MQPEPFLSPSSKNWGSTTKLVVALTFVAVLAALLIKFRFVLGPLLIALILAYLFQPVADALQRAGLSWKLSVALIYIFILLWIFGLIALGGVGLVQQIQSLVGIIQNSLRSLPDVIQELSGRVYQFGPFRLDFSHTDLNALSGQVLGMVQPLLSRTGTLLSAVAGRAASFVGWLLFVLLVSFFILGESGGLRRQLISIDVPTYREDIARLSRELGRIWNAFLRGQIIIFLLAALTYTIVLSILGVRYAFGMALLAGLARFVPYVGPAVNWTILVLVTYFQPYRLFGMEPLHYSLLVLVTALVIDQIFDNLISPRILADALKVHPAAVLVAAIIAANLLGFLGILLAAPILATLALIGRYTARKMFDLDPWPVAEVRQPPPPPGMRALALIRRVWRRLQPQRPPNSDPDSKKEPHEQS
ncbi:MAG TPA: AI-2E family transporter [Anaerolineales bacterium]